MVRPKKPADEVASERIDLRVTSTERAAYERAAESSGQSLSAWIKSHLGKAAAKAQKKA